MATQKPNFEALEAYIANYLDAANPKPLIAYLTRMGKTWDRDEKLLYIEETTFALIETVLGRFGIEYSLENATPQEAALWYRLNQLVDDHVLAQDKSKNNAAYTAKIMLRMIICQHRPELLV